jgi:uroporphyrinogen decarboxylase
MDVNCAPTTTIATMTSRERVRRALTFQGPDRAPRDLWTLGTIPKWHRAELDAVLERFPGDFARAPVSYGRDHRAVELRGEAEPHTGESEPVAIGAEHARSDAMAGCLVGRYTDEWGSEWELLEPGVCGEVRRPALPDWTSFASFAPPHEVLDGLDVSPSFASYEKTDKFVIAHSSVQPFQRLMALRGFESLMLDLGYERAELLDLLDMVHGYYVRELRLLAAVAADAITFRDDWGSQTSLLISPQQWRRLFKPLYADYCRIIHEADKFVFFHSDGQIQSIYPDLIEIGVDAINSQLFCMDIEALAEQHTGEITLWGEIDRQRALAFGTPEDVRAAVRRVRRAFDDGQGGLIAQCEWGNDTPRENIEAVFEAWLEPIGSF